jgi:hypothetical protein
LTPEEQEEWQNYYYEPAQLDKSKIYAAIIQPIEEQLRAAKQEVKDCEKSIIRLKRGKDSKAKENAQNKLDVAKGKVVLLNYQKKRVPIFHPSNSIFSIRTNNLEPDNERNWVYYCVYQDSDGKFYEAPVYKEWLLANLDPKYWNDLQLYCHSRQYLIYDELGLQIVKDFEANNLFHREQDGKLPQKIYTYKPKEDDIKVMRIRCNVQFSITKKYRLEVKEKETDLNDAEIETIINKQQEPFIKMVIKSWAICLQTKRRSLQSRYEVQSEDVIADIVDDAFLKKCKVATVEWFWSDHRKFIRPGHNTPLFPIDETRFIDGKDSMEYFQFDPVDKKKCILSPLGDTQLIQPYYWNLAKMNCFLNSSKVQISGIRYSIKKRSFMGLEVDPHSKKTKHVKLLESWVEENFEKDVITTIKDKAEQTIEKGKLYYKVPIGSARDTELNETYKNNPPIIYPQLGENSCCFKALSSGLAYLNMHVEAKIIDDYRVTFYQSKKDQFHRIFESIATFIRSDDAMRKFRQSYTIKKLTNKHDIQSFNCKKEDIQLVTLHAIDKSSSHAISVVDRLIFDCNCSNAMNLSLEALNVACGGHNFVSIYKGYLFEKKIQ